METPHPTVTHPTQALEGGLSMTDPRAFRRAAVRAATLLYTLALTACAGLSPPADRPQPKAAESFATEQSFAAPAGNWPVEAWWKGYGDDQLDTLIDEALAGSPTIAIAQARLRRAEALAGIAASATRPQVSANATTAQQKQSQNYLSPAAMTPDGWNDYGRATLDFFWELDFWGRNRAALAAATSDADAAEADAAQARLALSTAIASEYAELARLHAALDTATAALAVRVKTVELFRQRHANGLETRGSVRQVEARRASAEGDVLAINEQLALQRNQIAALLGAGPDRGLTIARPKIDLSRSFALPAQLAAELLGRRPDVVAARLRAQAAEKRISQARAEFYPNVNLVAFIGKQSLGLDVLSEKGSTIGSVGPAISLPIFNGGRLRAQLRGAEADYAEAVANYDGTVTQALRDVADAAVSQKTLEPQLAKADEAVDAAREAWRIQNNRYEGGLSTYLDVLTAEDYLLTNLRTQSDLQSRAFSLDVALVRALGGGYATRT
jgi:NodT family efflux transporter outer membrane factor (OMF) lipoprotein